jgi:hypothetical protein
LKYFEIVHPQKSAFFFSQALNYENLKEEIFSGKKAFKMKI